MFGHHNYHDTGFIPAAVFILAAGVAVGFFGTFKFLALLSVLCLLVSIFVPRSGEKLVIALIVWITSFIFNVSVWFTYLLSNDNKYTIPLREFMFR